MSARLNKIIEDPRLAWTASSFASNKDFTYKLSKKVLAELASTNLPEAYHNVSNYLEDFPELKSAASEYKENYLKNGLGFGTIIGLNLGDFSESHPERVDKLERVYWLMCNFLGTPLAQNAQGDLRYYVRDMGKTMETGGRYSETRQGGVLHTDSVQWDSPPDILGLLCLHHAMIGGDSVVVSAYSIHNRLLQENPDLLDVLYEPFPFETRRGDGKIDIIKKPIFTYNEKDGLRFRYIGTYVANELLDARKKAALGELDKLLEDKSLVVSIGTLRAGDINFMMNHRMAHGRGSGFVNYPEKEKERVMVRAWLREKNGK